MTEEELKLKLFEVMFAMDSMSAGKDFVGLRNKHYSNQIWLHNKGLQEEYYDYFVGQLKGGR